MDLLSKAVALAAKIKGISDDVLARHIGRADVVEATWLALLTGRPAFFLGTPGVDKTGTVEAVASRIDGAQFFEALMPTVVSAEQLLVESTSIEELPSPGGGKSIRTRDTLGRAANAHLVFADEVWKADPRVLQTLLDLSKGDGVRHEGAMVKTPLLAFLAASNELPEEGGNLGALWSRMTIRVKVAPLDRAGKERLVAARLNRQRGQSVAEAKFTLDEVKELRQARSQVVVDQSVVDTVFEIYEQLLSNHEDGSFQWLWDDDRRFGRVFDVLQAEALLAGRDRVTKQDLRVLAWMLWNTPEQIPQVGAVLEPYIRTPVAEAREMLDALLAAGGLVDGFLRSTHSKMADALSAVKECVEELEGKKSTVSGVELAELEKIIGEAQAVRQRVVNKAAGLSA